MRTAQIIEESERRRQALEVEYKPFEGIGSYIDRIAIDYEKGWQIHVPAEMLELEGVRWCVDEGKSIQHFYEKEGYLWNEDDGKKKWMRGRVQYDYEFFCHVGVHIETKTDGLQTLKLNRPQRLSLVQREAQRLARKPIRQIELKHRQYGSTTEKNAYVAWYQNQLKERWNGYIISLQADAAKKIVARYKTIADHYPPVLGSVTMAPYFGLTNTKMIKERNCWLSIGTAKNPNAPSGDTIQIALISEAGKMASNTIQNAEDLITNIISMVPLAADTMILVESTAEKSGKWFKNEVSRARNGESGFDFTFISWVTDESRVLPVENKRTFVESWSEYERETLWQAGATIEQINWYREKSKEYPEEWRMKQENPTTPEEAFQAGQKRVFIPSFVNRARSTCMAPVQRGELISPSGIVGPECLRDIEFVPSSMGHLRIWRMPDDDYGGHFDLDRFHFTNRYCAAADVGGRWKGSDFSNCSILDRLPTFLGEPPEVVADWYGRGDADLFAWICIQMCTWYDRARLFIESNYFERNPTRDEIDPSQVMTVLDVVREHYGNIYLRVNEEDVREKTDFKVGFHMNKKTKPLVINMLNAALRKDPPGYVERSYNATDELDTYIVHDNGYIGAADGKFDDMVITRALLMFGHDEMRPVEQVDRTLKPARPSASAAQF